MKKISSTYKNLKKKVFKLIENRNFIVSIFIFFSISASFQALLLPSNPNPNRANRAYTRYNNYKIFESSHFHLKTDKDLYKYYEDEHWDLFKYTPTFAAFFGVFTLFPDWLGLNLWNLLNTLLLVYSVYYLPKINRFQKGAILLFCLLELITSIQNEQSNAVIAGLIIFSFGLLSRNKYFLGIFCIFSATFIKLFGIVALSFFLIFEKKQKFIFLSFIIFFSLLLFPLFFTDLTQYLIQGNSYLGLLKQDFTNNYGFSLMGSIKAITGYRVNKELFVLIGIILFCLPLLRIKNFKFYKFRLLLLSSILIWVVIFNHKAESPTFIISVIGVAIWFITNPKSKLNIILASLVFIFASWGSTDLFPRLILKSFIEPFKLKGLVCSFVWFKIIYDMFYFEPDSKIKKLVLLS